MSAMSGFLISNILFACLVVYCVGGVCRVTNPVREFVLVLLGAILIQFSFAVRKFEFFLGRGCVVSRGKEVP